MKVVCDDSNLLNVTEVCTHFSTGNRINNFELSPVSTVSGTAIGAKRRNADHTLLETWTLFNQLELRTV